MASVIRRCDYRALNVDVPQIALNFQLDVAEEQGKRVCHAESLMTMQYKAGVTEREDLVLNAELTDLLEPPKIDGATLTSEQYIQDAAAETLIIRASALPEPSSSATFTLSTRNKLLPENNLQFQGLYCTSGIFCTQMEAEGYRRMVPSFDRPDVLSKYEVRIEGCADRCPVMLSNGNKTDEGALPGGRHFCVWQDPFPKPSYLFALVAGSLAKLGGNFTTRTGREVTIDIYCDAPTKVCELDHAMESLQLAMKWDEEQFGREYDLDIFNIVAVGDFNMGAMENKSLNVFNSKCVLGVPETATDATLRRIQAIIAHEYFHNWTGNRVTCRDWFQLTLKEGLTVYRDIRFTSDQSDPAVKRIQDVKTMRQMQMPEDAGPLSHPIRPEEYVKMDNFYTRTVYRKGAEVIRMYETLLGRSGFRRGMDLYFQRFDGMAVTCDDFLAAMADANDPDHPDVGSADSVSQDKTTLADAANLIRSDAFRRWYSQAGTPTLTVEDFGTADTSGNGTAGGSTYRLVLSQMTLPTPGQPTKAPLLVPVAIGLLDRVSGQPIPVKVLQAGGSATSQSDSYEETVVLTLSSEQQEFILESADTEGISSASSDQPVLTVLRNWSAPVKLNFKAQKSEDLALILQYDPDSFSRYEASSRLANDTILAMAISSKEDETTHTAAKRRKVEGNNDDDAQTSEESSSAREAAIAAPYVEAWCKVFAAQATFAAGGQQHLQALLLNLPTTVEVLNEMDVMDVEAVAAARRRLGQLLAAAVGAKALKAAYEECRVPPNEPYVLSVESEGRRALALSMLSFWLKAPDADEAGQLSRKAVLTHFEEAANMTDKAGAMALLANTAEATPERSAALASFEEKYRDHREAIDAWFQCQATCGLPDARARLEALMQHPAFSLTNPNKVRCIFGLSTGAPEVLYDPAVLELLGDVITTVDTTNPNLASGLLKQLAHWRRLPAGTVRDTARAVLERVRDREGCSKNSGEVAAAALA